MQYHVIPTSFAVAYQDKNGHLVAVSEGCSAKVAQEQAARLNAEWVAKQAATARASQRAVPHAQRRSARWFPDDKFA